MLSRVVETNEEVHKAQGEYFGTNFFLTTVRFLFCHTSSQNKRKEKKKKRKKEVRIKLSGDSKLLQA